MGKNKDHIYFCSSSFCEYDRRITRIIKSLSANYHISWYSRKFESSSLIPSFYKHSQLKTLFKRGIGFYFEINIRIFLKLLFSKMDIISAVDLDVLPAAYLASQLKSKVLVFDAHEIFHEVPELEGKVVKKKIWKKLSNFLFKRIKNKYTVNESLKNVFKNEFNTEFKVIRNLPLENKSLKVPDSEKKVLTYLGVTNKGRGLEIALYFLAQNPDYNLEVFGKGDEFEKMKSLSEQLEISNRVVFHDYVDPEKLFDKMANTSIGLNLLDPSSDNYKYSLANKFFDYIQAALPSVNMRFPEYSKFTDKYGVSYLVDTYDVEGLSKAIRFYENKDNYFRIQDNCLKARTELNWEYESIKLLEIYSNLKS